ncbi:MAG: hypothetical protein O7B81_00615, partial [Gammaproteobacteria bacterium]|nr:hypothetical protein [Gammaproteobacteria bacterium]
TTALWLARVSHHAPAAAVGPHAVTGRKRTSRRYEVWTTAYAPCVPSQRRLNVLATDRGEKSRLAFSSRASARSAQRLGLRQ